MKKIWESKTFWFNSIVTFILIVELVGGTFQEFATYTGLVAGIGNIILRIWFTKQPIK